VLPAAPARDLLERLDLVRVGVDGDALPLEDRRSGADRPGQILDELGELRADLLEATREKSDGSLLGDVGLHAEPVVLVLEGGPPVHPLEDRFEVRLPLREHWPNRSTDLEGDRAKALYAVLDQNARNQP